MTDSIEALNNHVHEERWDGLYARCAVARLRLGHSEYIPADAMCQVKKKTKKPCLWKFHASLLQVDINKLSKQRPENDLENNIIKVPGSWATRDELHLNVIDPGDWVQGNPNLRSIVPAGLKANEKISIHNDLIYTRERLWVIKARRQGRYFSITWIPAGLSSLPVRHPIKTSNFLHFLIAI